MIEEFAGGPLPPVPDLPLAVHVPALSSARALDAAVVIGVTLALLGLGWLVREAGARALRPWVFAGVGLGLLSLAVVNPLWWQVGGLVADGEGLVVQRHSATDQRVAWADVQEVYLDPGRAFPVFTDDRALVLVDGAGRSVRLPAFLPRHDEIAALVAARTRPEALRPRPR